MSVKINEEDREKFEALREKAKREGEDVDPRLGLEQLIKRMEQTIASGGFRAGSIAGDEPLKAVRYLEEMVKLLQVPGRDAQQQRALVLVEELKRLAQSQVRH